MKTKIPSPQEYFQPVTAKNLSEVEVLKEAFLNELSVWDKKKKLLVFGANLSENTVDLFLKEMRENGWHTTFERDMGKSYFVISADWNFRR